MVLDTLQQRSLVHDENLPILPAPEYASVAKCIAGLSAGLIEKHRHEKACKALESNQDFLERSFDAIRSKLDADSRGPDGISWASSQFKDQLLSLRLPLQSSALAGLVDFRSASQAATAATVLHRLAIAFTSTKLIDFVGTDAASRKFSTSQIVDLFATSRLPHDTKDELKTHHLTSHVVIWANGNPYRCDILDNERQPVQIEALHKALRTILQAKNKTLKVDRSVAWASSMLPRNVWSDLRCRIAQDERNVGSMGVIESAIASIALEGLVPESDSQRLRLSRGDSANVYSDTTMGLSIYADGTCAGRADHCVADGGLLCRVLEFLAFGDTMTTFTDTTEAPMVRLNLQIPETLFPESVSLESHGPERVGKNFYLAQDPDVLGLLRESRLLNFTVQLAFQCAILSAMGSEQWLVVEPTDMRSFSQGRCNPNYIVTPEAREFFQAIIAHNSFEAILARFVTALNRYRVNAKHVKSGSGVGPGAAILRGIISQMAESSEKSVLLGLLRPFQTPDVMFTGVPFARNVNSAEAFLYGPNQMAMVYVGKTNGITVSLAATGKMSQKMHLIQSSFSSFLTSVGTVAAALGCTGQMYPHRDVASLLSSLQGPSVPSTNCQKTSLAIHGGAGEIFGLNPAEKVFAEFLMTIVVTLGKHSLALGERALDVVQDCVIALQNCPFFNAGKGAVFNAIGKHLLEACIVDGSTGRSGAVANISTTRNPINAARCVLEKLKPCLISGVEADVFATNCGLEAVANDCFSVRCVFVASRVSRY